VPAMLQTYTRMFIGIITLTKQPPDVEGTMSPAPGAGAPDRIAVVEEILKGAFQLARPDDVAFLESQVGYIAGRIVDALARLNDPI